MGSGPLDPGSAGRSPSWALFSWEASWLEQATMLLYSTSSRVSHNLHCHKTQWTWPNMSILCCSPSLVSFGVHAMPLTVTATLAVAAETLPPGFRTCGGQHLEPPPSWFLPCLSPCRVLCLPQVLVLAPGS